MNGSFLPVTVYRMRLTISPETLKQQRLLAILSQEELAERAGLSAATVRRIEAGRINGLQPITVRKLAEALGCDPQELSEVVEASA